ncbi:MAG TPA: hypothetical protein VEZ50_03595 [Nodosilinea sp.]|nr:hypothetical protein [Nodosilinea sp.]
MYHILSTGTAVKIAVTTGDAGQLGMAAGFAALTGDRRRGNLYLWFGQFVGLWGCLITGDRTGWRYSHPFSQHFVFQH